MRTHLRWVLPLALMASLAFLVLRSPTRTSLHQVSSGVDHDPPTIPANPAPPEAIIRKRAGLTAAQLASYREAFTNRLYPAFDSWAKVYSGHIPFNPQLLTVDALVGELGRGNYCMYTFMLDGVTLSIEDVKGVVHVSYLSSPEAKKLAVLPRGVPPNPELPLPRSEIERMASLDSGSRFPTADIRLIPTAFSSAMNGGVQVQIGGDPNNAASWKLTLVFGPDGKLTYYCRGHL